MVGENITVTVKGQILKRVTAGKIDVDLRLMKFIKLTPQFDLCDRAAARRLALLPDPDGAVAMASGLILPADS